MIGAACDRRRGKAYAYPLRRFNEGTEDSVAVTENHLVQRGLPHRWRGMMDQFSAIDS